MIYFPVNSNLWGGMGSLALGIQVGLYLMWRRQAPPARAANLCNQFLIDYLGRKKAMMDRQGMQRKGLVYQSAMASIRKYPLPLISVLQLKNIYGVGEHLAEELVAVIKIHYRDFLKKNPQERGASQQQDVQAEGGQMMMENDENSRTVINSRSLAHSTAVDPRSLQEDILGQDSRSCLSVKSATLDRQYKPRAGSLAACIMIGLRQLGKEEFVQQENLKQCLRKEFQQATGKQYQMAVANLIKGGLLQRDQLDQNYIRLTEKGLQQCEKLENKTKVKQSQAKILSLANSFRENYLMKKVHTNQQQKIEKTAVEQTIQTSPNLPLILLIDSRQKKDHQQQCFFQTRLQDKHGILCRSAHLPIGDFLWLYGDQVLDYVVQRKKADDLLSSIFDGRYKEQKYRLRNSGFGNVYYLFQGHLTGANATSEREVASALLKTRVKDGFKVVRVQSITESVKFLSFMTESIMNRLSSSSSVKTLGTLQEFAANNGKSCNLTVEQVFGLSLKTIPGVGKASVAQILKYFNSFHSLYIHLKQLPTALQRIQFLRQLLKGCGVSRQIPQLLVGLLFCTPLLS